MKDINDRVRANTSTNSNAAIDRQIIQSIHSYLNSNPQEISEKIEALEREWSIERWLEMNASIIALIGILLGAFIHIYWLFLSALVLIFFFQHALEGWCPPVPILRYYGVRTRREIDWEKYSLKILRGDFDHLPKDNAQSLFEIVRT